MAFGLSAKIRALNLALKTGGIHDLIFSRFDYFKKFTISEFTSF